MIFPNAATAPIPYEKAVDVGIVVKGRSAAEAEGTKAEVTRLRRLTGLMGLTGLTGLMRLMWLK